MTTTVGKVPSSFASDLARRLLLMAPALLSAAGCASRVGLGDLAVDDCFDNACDGSTGGDGGAGEASAGQGDTGATALPMESGGVRRVVG